MGARVRWIATSGRDGGRSKKGRDLPHACWLGAFGSPGAVSASSAALTSEARVDSFITILQGRVTLQANLIGSRRFPTGGKPRDPSNRGLIRCNSGGDGKVRMEEDSNALLVANEWPSIAFHGPEERESGFRVFL